MLPRSTSSPALLYLLLELRAVKSCRCVRRLLPRLVHLLFELRAVQIILRSSSLLLRIGNLLFELRTIELPLNLGHRSIDLTLLLSRKLSLLSIDDHIGLSISVLPAKDMDSLPPRTTRGRGYRSS